ncbi:MAG: HEAT repeat domain-containing protein [Planctomycetota bacterium]
MDGELGTERERIADEQASDAKEPRAWRTGDGGETDESWEPPARGEAAPRDSVLAELAELARAGSDAAVAPPGGNRAFRRARLLAVAAALTAAGIFFANEAGHAAGEPAESDRIAQVGRWQARQGGAAAVGRKAAAAHGHSPTSIHAISRQSFRTPQDRMRSLAAFKAHHLNKAEELIAEVQSNRQGLRGPAAYLLASFGDARTKRHVTEAFLENPQRPGGLLALAAAELHDPSLCEDISALYKSSDPLEREAAAIALQDLVHPPPAILLRLCGDPDARVRQAAARTLGLRTSVVRSEAFLEAVALTLQTGTESQRLAALRVCTQLRSAEALDLLAEAVHDPNVAVRIWAIDGLARLGGPAARAALRTLLWDGQPRDRRRAVEGLITIGPTEEDLDELEHAEREFGDRDLTLSIARAMVRARDRRGIDLAVTAQKLMDDDHRAYAEKILSLASERCPPMPGESWEFWWLRVKSEHQFPKRLYVPAFHR